MNRASKAGFGPGSLVHIGEDRQEMVGIRIFSYNNDVVKEEVLSSWEQCKSLREQGKVLWIDVDGIHDQRVISGIGDFFGIHILVLEDIMNSESRPKVEFFDNYHFLTLKMLDFDKKTKALNVEQFSLVVGEDFVISFQERPGDSFDGIRERIRTAKGRVRSKDGYYLSYLLLDVIIDNYIAVSENYGDQLERLERVVLKRSNESTLIQILSLRKELLDFKRSIDPLKEAINLIQKELDDNIAKYYRDLYDHIIYESENLAMYREIIVNLLDLHHASLSVRTNNVMRVLTIITTIFVPLTFVVGVYGMNFENMPELKWPNGYYYVLSFMGLVTIGMLIYFQKKKWL